MPPPAERAFCLPGRQRTSAWLWLLALALHLPLMFLLVTRRADQSTATADLHRLTIGHTVLAVTLPAFRQTRAIARPGSAPAAVRAPVVVPSRTPIAPLSSAAVAVDPTTPVDTVTSRAPGDLRPHYGAGQLWVQPMVESPRNIAKAMSGKTDQQLTDSAVAVMIQTYFDAMAAEMAVQQQTLPSWTTKIGGKTVGLDSRWIYLGPIKIPTALLALLPINLQGNMSNYQYNQQLQSMRSDLFEAARHAATYDDFKKAVKDLHDQTAQRREFTKNQRTRPDTSHRG